LEDPVSLIKKKSDHEENIIKKALVENQGNITRTAATLGISRQLLYYKIKKFRISRDNI
jgi:arginine utilization regulatory protein